MSPIYSGPTDNGIGQHISDAIKQVLRALELPLRVSIDDVTFEAHRPVDRDGIDIHIRVRTTRKGIV